jgi:surfactin synthase thioesterase subunit
MEQTLAAIWAQVLKVERVGLHDNFFELGGHSLLALRMRTELRKVCGIDVSLKRIFQHSDLDAMAREVAGLLDVSPSRADALVSLRGRDDPKIRLVWFPYAGSGPAAFRPYVPLLPETVSVDALQLPGRERRADEHPVTDYEDVLREALSVIDCDGDVPVVWWGHSMGGLLAFELCLRFAALGRKRPAALIISGCPAPSLPLPEIDLSCLSDTDLVAALARLGGTPEELLSDSDALSLLLPLLKADYEVARQGRRALRTAGKIDVPLLVLGDASTGSRDVSRWEEHTTCFVRTQCFSGGHFFIHSNRTAILQSVLEHVQACGIREAK